MTGILNIGQGEKPDSIVIYYWKAQKKGDKQWVSEIGGKNISFETVPDIRKYGRKWAKAQKIRKVKFENISV